MSDVIDAAATHDEAVAAAAEALRAGDLVVVPTDTVYGVAADAFRPEATAKIFRAKRRSRAFPLPVLIRGPKQLLGLVTAVPETAERLMAAYWPGPLTIVVATDPNLSWDLGDAQGTVAVRMPLDDVTLEIIRAVGPLAVTSANLSGQPAARDVRMAQQSLQDQVAVYVDGGQRADDIPSTIVDLTRSTPHVLREGVVPADEALAVATGELAPDQVGRPDDDLDGDSVDG
jgi:tRNA threonylcarbamoyl adenosine modification protein (Sua5/YciO/YrdC/YwlC family)